MYQLPQLGGIGMFDLSTFLDSQRFAWIVRAYKFLIDNWRYDLHAVSPLNNVLLVKECDVNVVRNPIIGTIVRSFEKIRLSLQKKNIWDSEIFENRDLLIPVTNNVLNCAFFGRELYEGSKNEIRQLKLKECFNGNALKSCEDFNNMGIRLTRGQWFRLAGAILSWKNYAQSLQKIYDPVFSLSNFIASIKKRFEKGSNNDNERKKFQYNGAGFAIGKHLQWID
jgi:hypothetical protein